MCFESKLEQLKKYQQDYRELMECLQESKKVISNLKNLTNEKSVYGDCEDSNLFEKLISHQEASNKLSTIKSDLEMCENWLSEEQIVEMKSQLSELSNEVELLDKLYNEVKPQLGDNMVKLSNYNEQYGKCESWLTTIEPIIDNFDTFYRDLVTKRQKLEEFQQIYLQQIFDWQTEFHNLNVQAHQLFELYPNSGKSSSFYKLSNRCNDLIYKSKNILHSLEQRFQEHQQQQSILNECRDFYDECCEKYDLLNKYLEMDNYADLNCNFNLIKSLFSSLRGQGETKLSYLEDLTKKVLQHTNIEGTECVQEDVYSLRQDYDNLIIKVSNCQNEYQAKVHNCNSKKCDLNG